MKRVLGLLCMTVLPALLLGGCELDVLSPMGQVGAEEKRLILIITGLMLIVVVPVIVLTLIFAYRYRASAGARYEPNWSHSNVLEAIVWGVPVVLIIIMGVMTWISTHTLDPYRPLDVPGKPLKVEVVALDWKWLFIYPEEGIATVNEMAMPVGQAVDFSITSDAVMNSFFIPRLGTQVYA
ncbi:MAG: ubiquinol oxidase subunit II, partial [Rhizomicrobium sp.]